MNFEQNSTAGDHPSWGDINRITEVSLYPNSMTDTVVLKFTKPPSVTKILSATQSAESKYNLTQWKKRKIKEFGYEGFQQYKQSNVLSCLTCVSLFLCLKSLSVSILLGGFWKRTTVPQKFEHLIIRLPS